MQRFIEHEDHVDIEENIGGIWAVVRCNAVITKPPVLTEDEKNSKYVMKHYYNNRERILKNKRNKNHEKYGLTKEQYDEMKKEQKGKCAICGKTKKLVIDHDHRNGKVRKLLCNQCNVGIGLLQDSPDILEIAKKYISDFLINIVG